VILVGRQRFFPQANTADTDGSFLSEVRDRGGANLLFNLSSREKNARGPSVHDICFLVFRTGGHCGLQRLLLFQGVRPCACRFLYSIFPLQRSCSSFNSSSFMIDNQWGCPHHLRLPILSASPCHSSSHQVDIADFNGYGFLSKVRDLVAAVPSTPSFLFTNHHWSLLILSTGGHDGLQRQLLGQGSRNLLEAFFLSSSSLPRSWLECLHHRWTLRNSTAASCPRSEKPIGSLLSLSFIFSAFMI
jgi:hypothetical protein